MSGEPLSDILIASIITAIFTSLLNLIGTAKIFHIKIDMLEKTDKRLEKRIDKAHERINRI